MSGTIPPTVGRRVHVWGKEGCGLTCLDPEQPFDGGIIFVHPDGKVNVSVTDHVGMQTTMQRLPISDPDEGNRQGYDGAGTLQNYATWMPFQVGQAKAQVGAAAVKAVGQLPSSPPAGAQALKTS